MKPITMEELRAQYPECYFTIRVKSHQSDEWLDYCSVTPDESCQLAYQCVDRLKSEGTPAKLVVQGCGGIPAVFVGLVVYSNCVED